MTLDEGWVLTKIPSSSGGFIFVVYDSYFVLRLLDINPLIALGLLPTVYVKVIASSEKWIVCLVKGTRRWRLHSFGGARRLSWLASFIYSHATML